MKITITQKPVGRLQLPGSLQVHIENAVGYKFWLAAPSEIEQLPWALKDALQHLGKWAPFERTVTLTSYREVSVSTWSRPEPKDDVLVIWATGRFKAQMTLSKVEAARLIVALLKFIRTPLYAQFAKQFTEVLKKIDYSARKDLERRETSQWRREKTIQNKLLGRSVRAGKS